MNGSPRLKVLFVTRKWPPAVGGMELYSHEIAAAMERYADIDVIALPGRTDGSPPSKVMLAGFVLRTMARLAVRARRYDVIFFGDFVLFPLAVFVSIMAPRSRRLIAVHGLDLVYGRRPGLKSWVYKIHMTIARQLQGTVHFFVANSSATANVAAELGLRDVVAIPLGVSLDLHEPPVDTKEGMVDHADASTGTCYVLFVGRIVPRKGLAWFVDKVLPLLPNEVSLKIVGAVWDEEELRRALSNPRSEYLGRVDDNHLHHLRRNAAITVMPNRHIDDADIEGFGIAALEAAADGSILVASGIEGIVDAVIDGKTGFLLPEGNAERWAAKIGELMTWTPVERNTFLAEARQIIEEKYSWDRVARQTLELVGSNRQF